VIFSRNSKTYTKTFAPSEMEENENSLTEPKPSKKAKITTDAEGFITPSPPRTRKQRKKALQTANFTSQNQFDHLSDSDMSLDDGETRTQQKSLPKPQQQHEKKTARDSPTSTKPAKPIVVSNTTFEIIKNSITALKLSKMPTIQKRHGKDFTITANNSTDKKLIVEKLKEVKQQHYTYTETQDRRLMFVLLGHYEIPVEKLKEKLNEAKIPAIKVTKINRSSDDPIFLVSFEKDTMTLNDLQYKYNELFQLRIRWSKYKQINRRPTQCRRCQRFGHAANNCALAYRCVKCTETHEPGCCKRTTREGLPSCINCGVEGHTSNSTSCPVYIKYVENIDAKKKKPQQHQPREFPATRHDWSQQTIPSIASQSSPSTSHPPIVNRTNREYRPPLNHAVNQNLLDDSRANSQICKIFDDFEAIPDIKETMQLFANLVEDLKSTDSQKKRLFILISYTGLMPQSVASQN
jgi:hypothetical protein